MHKWYRSWWIDPHIVQELTVKEKMCNYRKLFTKKFLSVGVKWYRSWWIDPHFIQGLLATRLCTQWINPRIQQIDRHPTEKWLRKKKLTIRHKKETHQQAFQKFKILIHQSYDTIEWHTYLSIKELELIHIEQECYQELNFRQT